MAPFGFSNHKTCPSLFSLGTFFKKCCKNDGDYNQADDDDGAKVMEVVPEAGGTAAELAALVTHCKRLLKSICHTVSVDRHKNLNESPRVSGGCVNRELLANVRR